MPKQVAVRQYSIATIHFDGLLLPMSLSSAVWAAVSTASISNSSQPLMTVMAYPPDFPVGPRRSISSSQASVPRRVPFIGKNWIDGLQAIVLRCGSSGAVRAAIPSVPATYGGLPLVTLTTSPPDLLVRT